MQKGEKKTDLSTLGVQSKKKGAQRGAQGLQHGAKSEAKTTKNRGFGQLGDTELHFALPGGPWRWVPAQKSPKIFKKYNRIIVKQLSPNPVHDASAQTLLAGILADFQLVRAQKARTFFRNSS